MHGAVSHTMTVPATARTRSEAECASRLGEQPSIHDQPLMESYTILPSGVLVEGSVCCTHFRLSVVILCHLDNSRCNIGVTHAAVMHKRCIVLLPPSCSGCASWLIKLMSLDDDGRILLLDSPPLAVCRDTFLVERLNSRDLFRGLSY